MVVHVRHHSPQTTIAMLHDEMQRVLCEVDEQRLGVPGAHRQSSGRSRNTLLEGLHEGDYGVCSELEWLAQHVHIAKYIPIKQAWSKG